jgi:hypothetical protein
MPIPVAVLSEAWVCGLWIAGIVGSNAVGGMVVRLSCLLCVVQAAVSATS